MGLIFFLFRLFSLGMSSSNLLLMLIQAEKVWRRVSGLQRTPRFSDVHAPSCFSTWLQGYTILIKLSLCPSSITEVIRDTYSTISWSPVLQKNHFLKHYRNTIAPSSSAIHWQCDVINSTIFEAFILCKVVTRSVGYLYLDEGRMKRWHLFNCSWRLSFVFLFIFWRSKNIWDITRKVLSESKGNMM